MSSLRYHCTSLQSKALLSSAALVNRRRPRLRPATKPKGLFAGNWKPGVTHRSTVTEMLWSNVSKRANGDGSALGSFHELCVSCPPIACPGQKARREGSSWPAEMTWIPLARRVDLWPLSCNAGALERPLSSRRGAMTLSRTLADSLHENFAACQLGGRGVGVRIRTGGGPDDLNFILCKIDLNHMRFDPVTEVPRNEKSPSFSF